MVETPLEQLILSSRIYEVFKKLSNTNLYNFFIHNFYDIKLSYQPYQTNKFLFSIHQKKLLRLFI